MNIDDMAGKRLRGQVSNPVAKRRSVPNSMNSLTRMRWPRPAEFAIVKNENMSRSTEPLSLEGHNFRDGSQRQSHPNFLTACRTANNFRICHPKPRRAINLDPQPGERFDSQSWDINSRLNGQQWYSDNDNDENDDFTQELEDRLRADQEVESIFWDLPQTGSSTLATSLPERPGNPIINDKLFLKGERDNYNNIDSKLQMSSLKRITALSQRECSIERGKRMVQEDFEAQNEIKELFLTPKLDKENNNIKENDSASLRSFSCSSELSNFESEFSKPFPSEISLEN